MTSRKVLLVSISGLLISLLILFLSGYFRKSDNLSEMVNGRIKEIKSDSIIVEGLVRSTDPQNAKSERRTVEFVFTSGTVFKKSIISATVEQVTSGKSFHPETKITDGSFSDFNKDTGIFKITSKDNLFSADKAVVSEIDYFIYDFPIPAIR